MNLVISQDSLDSLTLGLRKNGLLACMKNIFYLAVTISPLLVLQPRSYSTSVRRDILLAVRVILIL